MTNTANPATRATVVLSPHDGPLYSLRDIGKPGTMSAIFMVDAGALEEFTADPMVKTYLDNAVPVVAVFEDAADAVPLERLISGSSGH